MPDTTTPDLSDLDGFWTAPLTERAAGFAALRRAPGIGWFEQPPSPVPDPGPGYYALTRHAEVVEASRAPGVFRSGPGATSVADMPAPFLEFFGSMINTDDPRHARLRRIVSRGFTPRRLAGLQESIERQAREIVDDLLAAGECEGVESISARLPLGTICELMGIPAEHHRFVYDRSNVILGAGDPEYVPDENDIVTALLTAGGELAALMRELAEARLAEPTDDVTSALVNAEIDGERLTPDELASFFILLVVAGNETTRNATSWGLQLLTEHPEQRAAWLADLDGVTPTAIDEIVRWASPVIYMRRTLSEPAVLGGVELPAGAKTALFYWSANRDPEAFPGTDPEAFDVLRSPNPHLGFGGPGPHFCLGAHLARRQLTVLFTELLRRAPRVAVSGEPRRLRSMFINGITRLPVVADGGRAVGG
ncbi:cytochrome P450 [Pseudonocardia sp. HH130630-07]|uniref:cytochrome P450 n=1 Tax=Pseudonocardia sp. HH130630-07 TaxID=1690815 RepID=UPI000814DA47|nr:cytochrome P450 [Pseudonocardia sp. HH130630-07]ANY07355.1 cytochrome [Pseudonocardia sp. HH130630-07]